jgi:hypothetical protein
MPANDNMSRKKTIVSFTRESQADSQLVLQSALSCYVPYQGFR